MDIKWKNNFWYYLYSNHLLIPSNIINKGLFKIISLSKKKEIFNYSNILLSDFYSNDTFIF